MNWLFCLKWDPCELQERREKGVFRAAHPHTPFLGQCPPGLMIINWKNFLNQICSRTIFEMHTAPRACLLYAPGAVCFLNMILEHIKLRMFFKITLIILKIKMVQDIKVLMVQDIKVLMVQDHIVLDHKSRSKSQKSTSLWVWGTSGSGW